MASSLGTDRAKHLPPLEENPRAYAEAALERTELAPVVDLKAERLRQRDRARSSRKRAIRASTVSLKRLSKRELDLGRLHFPPDPTDPLRPRTRAECAGGARPCPYVSCAHHLAFDVSPRTGSIKANFPELEPIELAESCALDVADRGGETLERVGELMNLTRERVRQLETSALLKLGVSRADLRAVTEDEPRRHRHLPVLEAGDYPEAEDLAQLPFDIDAFVSGDDYDFDPGGAA